MTRILFPSGERGGVEPFFSRLRDFPRMLSLAALCTRSSSH